MEPAALDLSLGRRGSSLALAGPMRTMGQLRVGFFKNFKSSDTFLIEGDSEGLRSLGDAFRRLATSRSIDVVALHHRSGFNGRGTVLHGGEPTDRAG